MAWIDVDERHEGGPREVLGGALRGQDGTPSVQVTSVMETAVRAANTTAGSGR